MSFSTDLAEFAAAVVPIPEDRNYWLIRTQSGNYFDSFREHGFIAIEHDEVTYSTIDNLKRTYSGDYLKFTRALRPIVKEKYPDSKNPGIILGQILRFIYEIKKDDIVIIPSFHSQSISIGKVVDSSLHIASESEKSQTDCPFSFRKKVKWLKTIPRNRLDPFLWKVIYPHQAINNLNDYWEYIERAVNNFFVKANEASLVLEIEKEGKISAKELFELGNEYLSLFEDIARQYNLDISSDDIEVKITLNSPGLLQFKSLNPKKIALLGLLGVSIIGGGITRVGNRNIPAGTNGLLQQIDTVLDTNQRAKTIINQNADSLRMLPPSDVISENR